MKRRKKIAVLISAAVLAVSLAACGSTAGSPDTSSADSGSTDTGSADTGNADTGNADAETQGNILVAYFSYTGNTEEVAQQIAEDTGGDLVRIERSEPYDDVQTEGEEELESNARPEITVDLDSIDGYDTIFVGYPIWWDEAPMVISTFLESYDFSGKTIVPFCTSSSDSIDNSLHIFSELAPDAVIAEGLTANDDADIGSWLERLGVAAAQ